MFEKKCSNCGKNVGFFQKNKKCSYGFKNYLLFTRSDCNYVECQECSQSIYSKLSDCKDCRSLFCKEHIKNHEHGLEEAEMSEKIKCEKCGNELDESKAIECYTCNEQLCENCIKHCDECDNDFCIDCYEDGDTHECDIGFELIIGFKNGNDKTSFSFTNDKEAKDVYARFVNAIKNKDLFIEYNDSFIVVDEIKMIDLR